MPDETALEKLRKLEREWRVRFDELHMQNPLPVHAPSEPCCCGRCADALAPIVERLAEEQRAMVAAAREQAIDDFLLEYGCALVEEGNNSKAIRVAEQRTRQRTPADQRAALDKLLAQARLLEHDFLCIPCANAVRSRAANARCGRGAELSAAALDTEVAQKGKRV